MKKKLILFLETLPFYKGILIIILIIFLLNPNFPNKKKLNNKLLIQIKYKSEEFLIPNKKLEVANSSYL